jgi:L-iditol 2-dehydrogenase
MQALVKTARGPGHLALRTLPDPVPGPGELVISVAGCGICGTDLHIEADEYASVPPVVLGHETAGHVAAIGEGVHQVGVGDRVTTQPFFSICGTCERCRAGRPNLCTQRRSIGTHVNGAFAEYVKVPAHRVLPLPENLDTLAAAMTEPVACCAHGILDYAPPAPGDVAVVSGPGPMGLVAAQIARAAGAEVVLLGTSADERRLALGRQVGIPHVHDITRDNVDGIIADLTDGQGAPLVIECAGAAPSFDQCVRLAQPGGTLLQIGLYGKSVQVDMDAAIIKELRLFGSFGQVPTAWPRALDLMAAGKVQTAPLITAVLPLTQWADGFAAARAKSEGKVVLIPAG